MGKFIDLTGQRFGRLVAVRPNREKKYLRWECECDCGGTTITVGSKLTSGHTQSCGCLQRERTSEACKKDYTGQVFGRLTVLHRESSIGENAKYLCRCECGNFIVVNGCNLVTGATKSCGCVRKERTSKLKLSHGQAGTRLYRCWRNMKDRCDNPNNNEYKNYGGRGIKVCKEWTNFNPFYDWAISHGYQNNLTIERIDVNGNYCPENCTWITRYAQARNRTDNRTISFNGKTMIITDWAKELGISEATIRHRLNIGWSIERTLTTQVQRHANAAYS